jgi:hypothetical protein
MLADANSWDMESSPYSFKPLTMRLPSGVQKHLEPCKEYVSPALRGPLVKAHFVIKLMSLGMDQAEMVVYIATSRVVSRRAFCTCEVTKRMPLAFGEDSLLEIRAKEHPKSHVSLLSDHLVPNSSA